MGTGPIIDPGFQGRLSIPLHNLTSNRYIFSENDEIISLEITKMSPYPTLHSCKGLRRGKYKPTSIQPYRQVTEYLNKALGPCGSNGVVSSLIATTNDIRKTAEDAKSEAEKAVNTANSTDKKINRWGIIGTVIALATIFVTAIGLLIPTIQLVVSLRETQTGYETRIADLEDKISCLEEKLKDRIAEDDHTENTQQDNQTESVQQSEQEAISVED